MPEISAAAVDEFLSAKSLAVVGVSRNPKKFGSLAFRELKTRGFQVFAVNRNMDEIDGSPCYPTLQSLPEKVEGVVIVVPPQQTENVVREAEGAGIKRVWMQQGAESDSAIQYCHEHNITEVHGECILMFAGAVKSFHRVHRGFKWLFGKLPK